MFSYYCKVGLLAATALLLVACGEPLRRPAGGDSSIGVDSAAGDGSTDGSTDGAIDSRVATDSATPTDTSTGSDAMAGQCDPSCLAVPGAECCTSCGCAATDCTPVCASGWDCELLRCFAG